MKTVKLVILVLGDSQMFRVNIYRVVKGPAKIFEIE